VRGSTRDSVGGWRDIASGGGEIRVLVALEDDYRVYRETIAVGLRVLRPDVEVKTTALESLEEELERFASQMVICSGHEEAGSGGILAWIELPLDPTKPTKIRIGERHMERTNPTLRELLELIEESE
jgi:hypothetical protein